MKRFYQWPLQWSECSPVNGIRLQLHGKAQSSSCSALAPPVVFPAYSGGLWLRGQVAWKGQPTSVPLVLPHRIWTQSSCTKSSQDQPSWICSASNKSLNPDLWTELSGSSFPVSYGLFSVQSLPFSKELWLAKLFSNNFSWKLSYLHFPNKSSHVLTCVN